MLAESRPNSRDLYFHQRNDRDLYYKRSCQIQPTNATVVTSINLINVLSTYRQLINRLARCHFAVANGALNPRFAAVTIGSCGDSWKLRRVAGEASNMTENALSILIVIFSVQLQQTEISERKLFIFHLRQNALHYLIISKLVFPSWPIMENWNQ